jgi:predicted metal-dependent phosphoesterase TrpH
LKLLIDLHVHSVKSGDSCISFDDAVKYCRLNKLDGLAITDHDTLTKPVNYLKIDDLILFSGIEISARGAHILAFDINEEIPPGLSIIDTVSKIHDIGGIAIIAHPYSVFRTWVNPLEIRNAGFNAIEVANALQFPYGLMLEKNIELAQKLGLPQTGGSDAHVPKAIGRAYTIFETDSRSVEGVLSALRSGATEPKGRGITLAERLKISKR